MKESPGIIARLARTYRLAASPAIPPAADDRMRVWATHVATRTVLDLGLLPVSRDPTGYLIRAHTHPEARRLHLPLAP